MTVGPSNQGRPQSVALVFILGILISSAVYYLTRQEEKKRIRGQFERRAEVQLGAFRESLNRYQELLRVTRSFVENSEPITRREFQGFAQDVMPRFPGIQALEWVPRVQHSDRANFEAAAR